MSSRAVYACIAQTPEGVFATTNVVYQELSDVVLAAATATGWCRPAEGKAAAVADDGGTRLYLAMSAHDEDGLFVWVWAVRR